MDELLELRDGKLHLRRMSRPLDPVYRDVISRLLKKKKEKTLKFWITSLRVRSAKFLPILLPDKKARKKASESIKQICKGSDFGKAVGAAVQEMIAAVVTTVVITGAVH